MGKIIDPRRLKFSTIEQYYESIGLFQVKPKSHHFGVYFVVIVIKSLMYK